MPQIDNREKKSMTSLPQLSAKAVKTLHPYRAKQSKAWDLDTRGLLLYIVTSLAETFVLFKNK